MKKINLLVYVLVFIMTISCTKESRFAIDTEDPIEVSACRATFKATGKNGSSKKIREKGFCYVANGIPTINDNPTPSTNGFVDLFEAEIKGLTANTNYRVRAYTKLTDGTVIMGDINEFTTTNEYMVGDIGPSNGIIYAANPSSSSYKYSEAILIKDKTFTWGCFGVELGASGLSGSSISNSNVIKYSCGSNNAAAACLDLEVNGVSDWYLPSAGELTYLHSCAKANPGVFPSTTVWSSSEWDTQLAYGVDLGGSSNWLKLYKNAPYSVIAVRFFN